MKFSPRVKTGTYVLEGLNAFSTTLYFNYLFFHTRDQFGFTNLGNLTLAALNGLAYVSVVGMAGRFAQKYGYFRALKVGFLIMAVALILGVVVRGVNSTVITMVIWTLGIGFTWPALEAIVSEHEPPGKLQRRIGIYNVIWALGSGLATFVGGALQDRLGTLSTFTIPAVIHLAQLGFLLWLEQQDRGYVPVAMDPNPTQLGEQAASMRSSVPPSVFMKMAWVANPFSYVAINGLIPVIPQRAVDLNLDATAAGVFSSVWFFARSAAFVGLWLWTGWHYRFRWLIWSYVAMAICFVLILVGHSFWLLIGAQVVFGFAVGLTYYSSLFYSMDIGDTKGEHGGLHETALGMGIFGGPAIGAVSLRFFPDSPNMNTWAVAVLLTVGMAGLLALRYRPGRRQPPAADRPLPPMT